LQRTKVKKCDEKLDGIPDDLLVHSLLIPKPSNSMESLHGTLTLWTFLKHLLQRTFATYYMILFMKWYVYTFMTTE